MTDVYAVLMTGLLFTISANTKVRLTAVFEKLWWRRRKFSFRRESKASKNYLWHCMFDIYMIVCLHDCVFESYSYCLLVQWKSTLFAKTILDCPILYFWIAANYCDWYKLPLGYMVDTSCNKIHSTQYYCNRLLYYILN